MTASDVATANAVAVCPEGKDRRFSRTPTTPAAWAVYRTGRLRWIRALVHSVVSEVHATAFTSIAALPRARAAGRPLTDASRPPPATPSSSRLLPVAAPREARP